MSGVSDYMPPLYEASSNVEFFHAFPRFIGDNNITAMDGMQGGYAFGVAIWPTVYIAIALFTIIFFFCAGLCNLCRCCKAPKEPEASDKVPGSGAFWFKRGLYLTVGLAGIYGAWTTLGSSGDAADTADSIVLGLNNADEWVTITKGLAIEFQEEFLPVNVSYQALRAAIETGCEEGGSSFPKPWYMKDIIGEDLRDFNDSAADVEKFLNDAPNFIQMAEDVESRDATRATFTTFAFIGVAGVLGFCSFAMLVTSITNQPGKEQSCGPLTGCIRAISFLVRPVGLVATVLWFLLAGVLLGANLMMSDLCVDPHHNIPAMLQFEADSSYSSSSSYDSFSYYSYLSSSSSSSSDSYTIAEEVEWYLTCEENVGSNIASGLTDMNQEITDINIKLENLTMWTESCDQGVQDALDDVYTNWAVLEVVMSDFADQGQCSKINPTFVAVIDDAMCTSSIDAFYAMWLGMTISGAGLLVNLWFYSSMTNKNKNPYRQVDDQDAAEKDEADDNYHTVPDAV
jgi:hypothetical protein